MSSIDGGDGAHTTSPGLPIRRVLEWFVFGVLPVLVFCWWMSFAIVETNDEVRHWAFDTRQFWLAGEAVLAGESPYPTPEAVESASDDLDEAGILETFRFAYPAGAVVLLSPLSLLGLDDASAVWGGMLVGALVAAVWLLGVRDWRVFGVVIGAAPVISAVRIGTLTPLLMLLLAAAWHWRDRRLAVSSSLALAVMLKLFLWPLVVWLVATRRWIEAVLTAALAAGATLVAWTAIGFDGLADYPELVRRLAEIVDVRGFSLVALGHEAGVPEGVAAALPLAVGVPLLVGVFLLGRRDDHAGAFSLAVIASLALTPIVWTHYFALLVVPLALARPRLAWPWGLMWVLWLVPAQESDGALWRILLALAVTAVVAVVAVRGGSSPASRVRRPTVLRAQPES